MRATKGKANPRQLNEILRWSGDVGRAPVTRQPNESRVVVSRSGNRVLFGVAVVLVLIAAAAVRYPLIPFESMDLVTFVSWYNVIARSGVTSVQSDYNVLYLYLFAAVAALLPDLHAAIAVKLIPLVFDCALAFAVYKCVAVKYRTPAGGGGGSKGGQVIPFSAGAATLLAPTVVFNGSLWGQCDAVYTTFLVACLYFLLVGRRAWALAAFGLAFSFKLQAMFLAPLFVWLVVKRACGWRHLLIVPAVYLATLVPAWLAGRPLWDLLTVYFFQVQKAGLGLLSRGLPNLYVWVPDSFYQWWPLGVVMTTGAVALVALAIHRSAAKVTGDLLVLLATYSVLAMPYILPKMHNRYFFAADVFTIVLAFWLPRYWFLPIVVGLVSLYCYFEEHFWIDVVDIEWLAAVVAVLVAILTWQLVAMLRHRRILPCRQLLFSLAACLLALGLLGWWIRPVDDGTAALNGPIVKREISEWLRHYRDYATTAIETAFPRTWASGAATFRANDRYQAAYERIVSGDLGEPLARSHVDVYRDGKTLIYVNRPCKRSYHRNADLFLHFTLSDGRMAASRHFRPRQRGALHGDRCVAIAPLHSKSFTHMSTGRTRGSTFASLPLALWETPAGFDANDRHRVAYRRVIDGDFGEPLGRSVFDVYRNRKTLLYVKQRCTKEDVARRFFLHVTVREHGAAGWSFDFVHRGVMAGTLCVALAELPDDAIERIHTGQYRADGQSEFWSVERSSRQPSRRPPSS